MAGGVVVWLGRERRISDHTILSACLRVRDVVCSHSEVPHVFRLIKPRIAQLTTPSNKHGSGQPPVWCSDFMV